MAPEFFLEGCLVSKRRYETVGQNPDTLSGREVKGPGGLHPREERLLLSASSSSASGGGGG